MPAPFVRELCGYRNKLPNTSDSHDTQSIYLGEALFARIGVREHAHAPQSVGALMESLTLSDLQARRPDLSFARSCRASNFAQYAHLGQATAFRSANRTSVQVDIEELIGDIEKSLDSAQLVTRLRRIRDIIAQNEGELRRFVDDLPSESMLNLDITVAGPEAQSELRIALSCKWTLRTARAQDCLSQGTKLVAQRRGRMPHFASLTMEPRPAMLALLADGSGSIDCIYHLDLPSLLAAAHQIHEGRLASKGRGWSPLATLERLVRQRRIRDYDDLVDEVNRIGAGSPLP